MTSQQTRKMEHDDHTSKNRPKTGLGPFVSEIFFPVFFRFVNFVSYQHTEEAFCQICEMNSPGKIAKCSTNFEDISHISGVLDGCLEVIVIIACISCCLPDAISKRRGETIAVREGARQSPSGQAITPARYEEGTLATSK